MPETLSKTRARVNLVVCNGTIYPLKDRGGDCPMPYLTVGQMKKQHIMRDLEDLKISLRINGGTTFEYKHLCWPGCQLECPARSELLKLMN